MKAGNERKVISSSYRRSHMLMMILGIWCRHHNVVLGCLLEKLGQARNESKLLGNLRQIFLARGVLETTPLEFLLMRSLLRRRHIGWHLTLVVVIVISVTWAIVVCGRLVIVVRIVIWLTVPSFATATGALIRRWAWGALSLRVWLLGVPLTLKLLLLLVKLFLVSLVHVLLLVLRLVVWTLLATVVIAVVILRSIITPFVVSVVVPLWLCLLLLLMVVLVWGLQPVLLVWGVPTDYLLLSTWGGSVSSYRVVLGSKSSL